jgi:hypothetical protein
MNAGFQQVLYGDGQWYLAGLGFILHPFHRERRPFDRDPASLRGCAIGRPPDDGRRLEFC